MTLTYCNDTRKLTRRLASIQKASTMVCPALKRRVTMARHLGLFIDSKYSDHDCTTLGRCGTMTKHLGRYLYSRYWSQRHDDKALGATHPLTLNCTLSCSAEVAPPAYPIPPRLPFIRLVKDYSSSIIYAEGKAVRQFRQQSSQ